MLFPRTSFHFMQNNIIANTVLYFTMRIRHGQWACCLQGKVECVASQLQGALAPPLVLAPFPLLGFAFAKFRDLQCRMRNSFLLRQIYVVFVCF